MKKWLRQGVLGLLLVATLAGGGLGTLVVFAQGETPESSDNADYLYRPIYPDQQGPNQQEAAAPPPSAAGQQGGDTQEMEPACSGGPLGVITGVIAGGLGKALECTAAWVSSWAMWISARTLWISGVLLNITLTRTLDMTELVNGFPLITIGWQIMRDIANIVFIFIALWAGISIIIGIKPEQAWGYLAQMVLVALFINFSLFITQVVVDTSNIAALHFYDRILDPEHRNDSDGGLSEAFMNAFKLQTLYNPQVASGGAGQNAGAYLGSVGQVGGAALSFTNIILIGIFGSIFMMVAAFTFFAAAILFIIRAVTLMMLMLLSPLAFVGLLLPGASGLAHEWWSKLWSQAFFAPLYMALAYVVVRAINDPTFQAFLSGNAGNTNASWAAAITGVNSGSVNIIFAFIILIALMMGCLLIAQSLGARGSESMIALGGKLKGEMTGFVGRGAMRGFGLGALGEKWQEKNAEKIAEGKKVGRVSSFMAGALKYSSVRNLNERLGQTKLGQWGMGKFLREQTVGRLTEAKFGGSKSAEEAYEESEHDASVRRAIGHISEVRNESGPLQDLRNKEREHQENLQGKRDGVAKAKKALREAKAPERKLKKAELDLAEAKRHPTTSPGVITQLEKNVATAKEEVKKSKPDTDVKQKNLADAEAAMAQAQADLKKFSEENQGEIDRLSAIISKAFAKLTTKEYIELTPKNDFFRPAQVDYGVLSSNFIRALIEDEHALTEGEKEEVMHARMNRAKEVSKRGEKRNEAYHDDIMHYQAMSEIASRVRNSLDSARQAKEELRTMEALTRELQKLREQIKEK